MEARRTLDRRRGGRKEVCCVSSVRLVGASGTARLRCARWRARSPSGGVEEWAKGSARVRRVRVDLEAKPDFSGLCLECRRRASARTTTARTMTCCACRHASGQPCDREELVLPIMGLFAEIYRDRHGETKDLYEAMFADGSTVDDYFPSHFDYETPFGQVVRKPLFGDLPRAIMDRVDREHGTEIDASKYLVPGADARFTAPLDEQLSNPRKLGRPRLFRQRTSSRPPDDGDAMTAASSFAPSSQRSSGRIVTDADSSPEKAVGLEERRSKRSAVVRLASAPLLDVADEPLSP